MKKKTYIMPPPINPALFIIILLAASLSAGLILPSASKARQKTRAVHTGFLFNQIEAFIEESTFPSNQAELISILNSNNVDWNSCKIEDQLIYDGWNNIITITFINETNLILQSSGKDCKINSKDDIVKSIEIKNG